MAERSGQSVDARDLLEQTGEELPAREGTFDRLKQQSVEEETAAQTSDESNEGRNE